MLNSADAWSSAVDNAIRTFNRLSLAVTLETTTDESSANVVVKVSGNVGTHTFHDRFYGDVTVTANFDASLAHGKTKTVRDPDRNVIVMAAIFLPMRLEGATDGIREVVTIHELIHAAGLDDDADHDTREGVFYGQMESSGGTLKEWGTSNASMPPVRIGPNTVTRLNALWQDSAG